MEDDVDWDVSLKAQLREFAIGSRLMLEHKSRSLSSPYGDGWDLLWLGHCGSAPEPGDSRRHIMKDDPTVPPLERQVNEVEIPDMTQWPQGTRIVYKAHSAFCMYGYGVSFQGAQKLLYHLSMQPYFEAIDLTISRLCGDPAFNFTCISVFPQLFHTHRAAGSIEKDTDIGDLSSLKDTIRKRGYTHNIVFSTRLNLERLINGNTVAERQWPLDTA